MLFFDVEFWATGHISKLRWCKIGAGFKLNITDQDCGTVSRCKCTSNLTTIESKICLLLWAWSTDPDWRTDQQLFFVSNELQKHLLKALLTHSKVVYSISTDFDHLGGGSFDHSPGTTCVDETLHAGEHCTRTVCPIMFILVNIEQILKTHFQNALN